MLKVLKVGAEAIIYLVRWNDVDLVAKKRIKKRYRDYRLDYNIRLQRTLHEARMLHEAKSHKIPCPAIIFIDRSETTIYMQFIRGKTLRNIIDLMDQNMVRNVCRGLGEIVGLLHYNSMIHGDLVTSNVMVDHDNRIFLLDFGLGSFSEDVEDKAVDIHLFSRALDSSHYRIRDEAMRSFLQGYRDVIKEESYREVIEKVKDIAKRGRYVAERRMGG